MVSKALLKSRKTAIGISPLSTDIDRNSWRSTKADCVQCFFLKPNCSGKKKLILSKKLDNRVKIIFS